MGSVVKHVTGALTGKSGGGETKSSSKETASSNTNQSSWLQNNEQYKSLETNALNEAGNLNYTPEQMAQMNGNQTSALSDLAKGVDTSGYQNAYNQFNQLGNSNYQQGTNTLNNAQTKINAFANMTQSDYQNMMKSEYNSDLVKSEIADLSTNVNDQEAKSVQNLNQQAQQAGAMGNSRAGVAQGVIAGQAQKAIASGTVQFQQAEEQAAASRLQSYLGLQSQSYSQLAGIGQQQQTMGAQMLNQGMSYFNQYNQALTQNAQNRLTAGSMQQQQQQQMLDMNRRNQIAAQSPSLYRLNVMNQTYLPMAGLASTGSSNGTSTSNTTNVTPGQGGNLLGGLMGMGGSMLGGYFGGGMGAQAGGMVGSAFGNSFGG